MSFSSLRYFLQPQNMGTSQQSDFTRLKTTNAVRKWRFALLSMTMKRQSHQSSVITRSSSLLPVSLRYQQKTDDLSQQLCRSNQISLTNFTFNFNRYSDSFFIFLIRFAMTDIVKIVPILSCSDVKKLQLPTATEQIEFSLHALFFLDSQHR